MTAGPEQAQQCGVQQRVDVKPLGKPQRQARTGSRCQQNSCRYTDSWLGGACGQYPSPMRTEREGGCLTVPAWVIPLGASTSVK